MALRHDPLSSFSFAREHHSDSALWPGCKSVQRDGGRKGSTVSSFFFSFSPFVLFFCHLWCGAAIHAHSFLISAPFYIIFLPFMLLLLFTHSSFFLFFHLVLDFILFASSHLPKESILSSISFFSHSPFRLHFIQHCGVETNNINNERQQKGQSFATALFISCRHPTYYCVLSLPLPCTNKHTGPYFPSHFYLDLLSSI